MRVVINQVTEMEIVKFVVFVEVLALVVCGVGRLFLPITLKTVCLVLGIVFVAAIVAPGIGVAFQWWMDL